MNPILLQKQLKENAADLDEFYKDLKNWGEDMKRKEESQKKPTTNYNQNAVNNKKRKSTSEDKKMNSKNSDSDVKLQTKSGYTDYTAWEKFDADAECEKVDYDENEESELSDEYDETLRDEAYVEKEKGNKFVKSGQWTEAIQCYTKAIDCYSYDPIFYANRALCFLKTQNMTKAEADCTMSLKLDKTYVKAYQRRAAARESLNKLEEAEIDLLKVLELEPKNKETVTVLEKLRKKLNDKRMVPEVVQRPVSKFTASRQQKKNVSFPPYQSNTDLNVSNKISGDACSQKKEIDVEKSNHWPSGEENIILVRTVNKPVHLQSKKPLKRIEITENVGLNKEEMVDKRVESFPTPKISQATLKTDDLKVIERQESSRNCNRIKETKNQTNSSKMNEESLELCAPKSSVQFYSQWKHLKNLENKYTLLNLIEPQKLPEIFKDSMESTVFSEILEILAKCFTCNGGKVFSYLLFLTKIRRFSTLIMFMTDTDKNYIRKLLTHISTHEDQSKEEVDQLMRSYEL